jgi:hypothetical protein
LAPAQSRTSLPLELNQPFPFRGSQVETSHDLRKDPEIAIRGLEHLQLLFSLS